MTGFLHRHASQVIAGVAAVLLVASAVAYQRGRDETQDRLQTAIVAASTEQTKARVASCVRGNLIRRGQRLDNQLAIDGLRRAVLDPVSTRRQVHRYEAQLKARVQLKPALRRFPCRLLRTEPNATTRPT